MSLLDTLATPTMDQADMAASVYRHPTPFSPWVGANIMQGIVTSPSIQAYRQGQEGVRAESDLQRLQTQGNLSPEQAAQTSLGQTLAQQRLNALTEDEYKASPAYREGMPFQEGMTAESWSSRADRFDEQQYHQTLIDNRETGAFQGTIGFAAQFLGGAVEPINYIPFGGEAMRVALMAKGLGRFGADIVAHTVEATAGQAAVEGYSLRRRAVYGEDVGFMTVVSDLGMAALTGATFAAVKPGFAALRDYGVAAAERMNLLPPQPIRVSMSAASVLDRAVGDYVNGRRIDVGPEARVAATELQAGMPLDERLVARLRERLKAEGIAADVVLPARPDQTPGVRTAAAAATGEAFPAVSPDTLAAARPETGAVGAAATAAPEGGPTPVSETPAAPRPAEASPAPEGSPVSREAFEAGLKDKLDKARAQRLADAAQAVETAKARMVEADKAAPGPERDAAIQAARDARNKAEVEKAAATEKAAGPVKMPAKAAIDAAYRREVVEPLRQGVGNAPRPRPLVDAMDTAVGRDLPDEMPDAAAQEVPANPDPPAEDLAGIDMASGDFAELDEFRAMQEAGLVAPEDQAAFTAADAEFETSKKYPEGFKAAAGCFMG